VSEKSDPSNHIKAFERLTEREKIEKEKIEEEEGKSGALL